MKVYGERTAFAETSMIALDLSRTETMALSDLGQVKKIGIEERFGRRYHVELKMGWGGGGQQLYHLGYFGKSDIEEGSVLHYGGGAGISTSHLPPDSLRERYFFTQARLLKGFDLSTQFKYTDYRHVVPGGWEPSYNLRNPYHVGLSGQIEHSISSSTGLMGRLVLERLRVAESLSENMVDFRPRVSFDFARFRADGEVFLQYSSGFLLLAPLLSYERDNITSKREVSRIRVGLGYVYFRGEDRSSASDGVVGTARAGFLRDQLLASVWNGYKIHSVISGFKTTRLYDGPGQAFLEWDRIGLSLACRPAVMPVEVGFAYRRVASYGQWESDFFYGGMEQRPSAEDLRIAGFSVALDRVPFVGRVRYDLPSDDVPFFRRLNMNADLVFNLFDLADVNAGLEYHSGRDGYGSSSDGYALFNVGVKRELLRILLVQFEVRNILGAEYTIWEGTEPGRTVLFSLQTRI